MTQFQTTRILRTFVKVLWVAGIVTMALHAGKKSTTTAEGDGSPTDLFAPPADGTRETGRKIKSGEGAPEEASSKGKKKGGENGTEAEDAWVPAMTLGQARDDHGSKTTAILQQYEGISAKNPGPELKAVLRSGMDWEKQIENMLEKVNGTGVKGKKWGGALYLAMDAKRSLYTLLVQQAERVEAEKKAVPMAKPLATARLSLTKSLKSSLLDADKLIDSLSVQAGISAETAETGESGETGKPAKSAKAGKAGKVEK